jgi:hypothetical protein
MFYSLSPEHSSGIHVFSIIVICEIGWKSKVTGYWLNGWRLISGGIASFFPSPQHPRLVLYQSPISLGVKRPECVSEHAHYFNTETRHTLTHYPIPPIRFWVYKLLKCTTKLSCRNSTLLPQNNYTAHPQKIQYLFPKIWQSTCLSKLILRQWRISILWNLPFEENNKVANGELLTAAALSNRNASRHATCPDSNYKRNCQNKAMTLRYFLGKRALKSLV